MADSNDDTMAAGDEAAAKPKKRRKRGSGAITRHQRGGNKKKSQSPHAPDAPRNPSQPTQPPTSDNTKDKDPRIFNLKRGEKRRDKKIEQLTADKQQLQREVVAAEKDMQLVHRDATIKVIAAEREANKVSERAERRVGNE